MRSYLKYVLIAILIIGICFGGFFAVRPVFNNNNSTPPSIETPTNDNQDSNNESDNSDNGVNTENNDNNNSENNNENNPGDTENDNNNSDNSDNNGSDNNDDNNDNSSDNNDNDNNEDNNEDNSGNNDSSDNSDNNDPTDNVDKTTQSYTLEIFQDTLLVYSDTINKTIYSNLYNGSYVVYTLVINSNYELPEVTYSENVTINSLTKDGFNITVDFIITNGTNFSFIIDNKHTTINCTPCKQYYHQLFLPAETPGATLSQNVITLTDTNEVMFQILFYEDNKQISCSLTSPDVELTSLYGTYYVQLESSLTATFNVVGYEYSFTIVFILK